MGLLGKRSRKRYRTMTKLGMRRTIPQLPLKRKTPLMANKGLNRMSDKAKEELAIWIRVKTKRMLKLQEKFGFVPCEYCHSAIEPNSYSYYAEGHHLDRNRRHNCLTNCRLLHAICHTFIHDHNIKDIPSLL